jgi:apolipoprotein N-acyltransferase
MSAHNNEDIGFIAVMAAAAILFFYIILGMAGAASALGIILFFMVPVYIILGNFHFESDERAVLGFFIGVGIFSSVAYWLGMFMSFKLSIFLAFILIVASGFAAKHFRRMQL